MVDVYHAGASLYTRAGRSSVTPPAGNVRPFPLVASTDLEATGETLSQKAIRVLGYGFNGVVFYSGASLNWNAQLQSLAIQKGTEPLNIQITPKSLVEADFRNIYSNVPAAWKPGFRWNYYQEPEDNLTTAAQQLAYRNTYTQAATYARDYPGMQLPWVELADYSLELMSQGNFSRSMDKFIPPANDYGGVLWSFFQYGENISMNLLDEMVGRIEDNMAIYAPGKPWEIMAACYTLEPGGGPFTTTQLDNQALWLWESFHRLRAAGCTGYAWYNVKFAGTGGAAGEGRVEVNPAALEALQDIAAASYTVPVHPGVGG